MSCLLTRHRQRLLFSLLGLLAWSGMPARADLLIGELSFESSTPTAAVIYVREPDIRITELQVDQVERQFIPFMSAGSTEAKITFRNSDSARHNLYANSFSTGTRFDVGMIPPGKDVALAISWPEDTLIRVGCAIHSNMETYIANIRSGHHAVLAFKRLKRASGGGGDEYGGGSAGGGYQVVNTNKAEFKLRSVPTDKTDISLIAPYFEPLNFNLKNGEEKSLDVIRDGSKRGVLKIRRVAGN